MAVNLVRDGGDESKEDEDGFSGSDKDSEFDEDMESLRRACMLTGTDLNPPSSVPRILPPESDSDNSDMDDYELARSVCQRLSVSADFEQRPMYLKPLSVVPPEDSDDGEDDFATLRAVQNRFSAYDRKAESSSRENSVQNAEQVRASRTPLETETSGNLFVHRTNACKGFPDSEDPYNSTQNLESSSPNVAYQDSGYLERHQLDIHVPRLLPAEGSGFPRAAQLLLDAIKKNRLCQKLVQNRLVLIEARIEENKKLKDRAKILNDFQVSSKRRVGLVSSQKKDPHVQLISAPKRGEKKASAMKFGPEDNRDVANYRDAMAKFPLSLQRHRWSNEEKDNLRKGIVQEFQKALLKKSVDLISYSEGSFGTSRDIDSVMASIKGFEITPENIRVYLPKVDWDDFASIYNKGRSGAECEARWLNWEDPLKNNTRWSRTEDKELLLIVKEKEMSNWIDIAVSLGTNRTPFQCLARFQRSLNAQMVKREWEEEEDTRLCAAVRVFGESNWQMVASVLDRRTGTQCSNRWKKTLNPARLRVGRWTIDEDKRMKVSVKLFGAKCWSKIAQFVPGRTQVQCRERWVNCLDPSLKRGPWTEDEDMKLMTAIGEYNYCWSKVAACIPPRTDNQCRRRWMALCPDDLRKLQAANKLQQVALISNFVDRETERPDLGPEDFLPPPMLCAGSEPNSEVPTKMRKRKPREKPASQLGSGRHNLTSSEARNKKRSRGRIKEVQMDYEATCSIFDGNEATICVNDYAATIENSTIEFPGSYECNERGKNDSSSHIDLAPTSTDMRGKPSAHNSSKRKKYKPRKKARAETAPVQRSVVPAAQGVPLQNNSVCHEIPVEDKTVPAKNRKTSSQHDGRKKYSHSVCKKNNSELEAAENIRLGVQMPETSAYISGVIGVNGKSCVMERVKTPRLVKDTVSCREPSEYNLCLESIAHQHGAENGMKVNDELFVDQCTVGLEDIGCEATCGIVDGNGATICINDCAASIENPTIECPGSFECNERGKDNSYSYVDLASTSTDMGGKPGTHNSSKRKEYKPRRKILAETASVQRMPSVPAAQGVPLQTNNSVCHEIAVEDNTTSAEKERTSSQLNGWKKNCRSISMRNNSEVEAAENMRLGLKMPEISANFSGVIGANSKSCKKGRVRFLKDTVKSSEYTQCLESNVYEQERATKKRKVSDSRVENVDRAESVERKQDTTDLMEDDTPLAWFIKKVKEKGKCKTVMG